MYIYKDQIDIMLVSDYDLIPIPNVLFILTLGGTRQRKEGEFKSIPVMNRSLPPLMLIIGPFQIRQCLPNYKPYH